MNIELGNKIKVRRHELNLSLDEVATRVGVAKSTIQRYEADLIKSPKLPVVESIANALRVNPQWLIGHDVPMVAKNRYPQDEGGLIIKINHDQMIDSFDNSAQIDRLIKYAYQLNETNLGRLLERAAILLEEQQAADEEATSGVHHIVEPYVGPYTDEVKRIIDEDTKETLEELYNEARAKEKAVKAIGLNRTDEAE